MLNSKVRRFDCYGEGWAFHNYITEKSNVNIDLSKFDWNKGYTLSFQHFGVLDPLFGNYETGNSWCSDVSFVRYILETNSLVDAWLNLNTIRSMAEDLGIEANKNNLDLLISAGIDRDEDSYIKDTITEELHFGKDFAICGVTDEEYFKDLVLNLGYDLENDELIDVIFLG